MKLRLPGPFIACVIAEFLVYDLQMQQRGRRWRSLFFFFFFFFLFRTPNMSGLLGEGRGQKAKFTNCHLIWQLECKFNVWGQLHLSAERLSFTSTVRMLPQIDVKVLLEQLIGFKVSMLLCTWIRFLWGNKVNMFLSMMVLCLIYNRSQHLGSRQHDCPLCILVFLFGSCHPPKLLSMRMFLKFTYRH